MIHRVALSVTLAAALSCAAAPAARAQCPSIDFENLATGTAVTTQYAGVTFSLSGTGCSPGTAFCRIIEPEGGTSSGIRGLGRDQGCPDFYFGTYIMTFSEAHGTVQFRLGEWGGGTYSVRAYNATTGGTLLLSRTIGLPGDGLTAVYYPVSLVAAGIRRVEITQSFGGQTVIDDLEFDVDATPPSASFSDPADGACFCYGTTISGTADDPDGTLSQWRLDRRAVGVSTWTLVTQSTTPIVDSVLSSWFPAASAADGYYVLRLTVTNACDLVSIAERVVYLDREFDELALRFPGAGAVIGGTTCVDGTAWEHCAPALDVFSVAYAPLPAGTPYTIIDGANPINDSTVITDPLASWNTLSPLVTDGSYRVRLTGTTVCGYATSITRDIVVDNTPPVAFITSPVPCGFVDGVVTVRGTVSDAHPGGWALYYAGGPTHTWSLIGSGSGAIANGTLGNWNTTGLPRCAYALRLVAYDAADADCHTRHNTFEYVTGVIVGCEADYNGDGFVNSQDFFDFLAPFFAGCP